MTALKIHDNLGFLRQNHLSCLPQYLPPCTVNRRPIRGASLLIMCQDFDYGIDDLRQRTAKDFEFSRYRTELS